MNRMKFFLCNIIPYQLILAFTNMHFPDSMANDVQTTDGLAKSLMKDVHATDRLPNSMVNDLHALLKT